jgi:tetrahydromethanopterin S-methyltransferase subunit G
MHPVFQPAFRKACDELARFDAESSGVHPCGRPSCWSVQQIVEHLVLSMEQTVTALEQRLAKGRPERRSTRSRTEWLLQLMVLSAGHMPRGVGATRETIPPAQMPSTGIRELIERLESAIERLDATLEQSRQRFGMERVGRHFLLGPLRVDQWRRYHVLHLQHHTRQMREVRETLSFEVVQKARMARV